MKSIIKKLYSYINIKKILFLHRKLKTSKNVYFERSIKIYNNGNIKIGKNSKIRSYVILNPNGGTITIGENVSINSFCHISGNGNVVIGNNVLIATQCVIVSANHNYKDKNTIIYSQGETKGEIVIEDDCWLGASVNVLAGVKISQGSVIGAGSVVTKDTEPYSVNVGVPSKKIGSRY